MPTQCVVCHSPLTARAPAWLAECLQCGLKVSALDEPQYTSGELLGWDDASEAFMRPLREHNTHFLIERLSAVRPLAGLRLLDVGCAAGWFLDGARAAGMTVTGIEPDLNIASASLQQTHNIIVGRFPDCLVADERYDVISFNDVFEHLPKPGAMFDAIRGALAPDGILLLNLPSADGIFYKLATLANRLGDARLLERLWQAGYESPHLYYFNRQNLQSLAQAHGLTAIECGSLPSIVTKGLWARVSEGDSYPKVAQAALFGGILLSYPLLRYVLPSDIMYQIYRPNPGH